MSSGNLPQAERETRSADPGRRLLDYISAFIAKVGFPIAVAIFALFMVYKAQTDSLANLTKGQSETNTKLDRIIFLLERKP